MGIFGIALMSRKGSKENVEEFFREMRISDVANVFAAVDKKDLSQKALIDDDLVAESAFKRMSMGEVACALSHREIFKEFLSNKKLEYAMIFEDDVMFEPGLMIQHEDIIKWIFSLAQTSKEVGWDGLNLGRCSLRRCSNDIEVLSRYFPQKKYEPINLSIINRDSQCTHAYLVTRKGAELLLEANDPIAVPEDHYRNHLSTFRYMTVKPRLFTQDRINLPGGIHSDQPSHLPECFMGTG
eukprot:1330948-Amorphochlora_amoeboformis.AAC.1